MSYLCGFNGLRSGFSAGAHKRSGRKNVSMAPNSGSAYFGSYKVGICIVFYDCISLDCRLYDLANKNIGILKSI